MTLSHICLILAYTVVSLLHTNGPLARIFGITRLAEKRIATTWTFIGGVAEIFITCMLWFIMDDTSTPYLLRRGDDVYAVLEVIRPVSRALNEEDDE